MRGQPARAAARTSRNDPAGGHASHRATTGPRLKGRLRIGSRRPRPAGARPAIRRHALRPPARFAPALAFSRCCVAPPRRRKGRRAGAKTFGGLLYTICSFDLTLGRPPPLLEKRGGACRTGPFSATGGRTERGGTDAQLRHERRNVWGRPSARSGFTSRTDASSLAPIPGQCRAVPARSRTSTRSRMASSTWMTEKRRWPPPKSF
jgi:hypothetical protein